MNESRDEQEAQWIREIAGGDREAFEALFHAWRPRLHRYALSIVGNPEAAEEIVDDVLVEVWRSAGRFRGDSRPSTWIFGIAHHKAVSATRRRRLATVELDEANDVRDGSGSPEDSMLERSAGQQIRGAISQLSPEHRATIELTFFDGMSYEEIAAVMGCPINTVKTRMFYAKKRLSAVLAECGMAEDWK